MDRNTVHLYETLGVPKSSTQDEIKKAYRLQLPLFLMATGKTCDPKKRQVYDKYGMMGVQMAGTEIGARLVEIESLLCTLFIVLSFVLTLIIIFFALLSVRVDGKVSWNYAIVFIPLWIMDALLFLGTLTRLIKPPADDDDEDDHNHDDHEDDRDAGNGDGTSSSAGVDREERQRQKKATQKWQRLLSGVVGLINLILFTAFQVLIVKKANDPTSISGTTVFAPYFALEGFFFLLALIQVAVALKGASAVEAPLSAKLGMVFEALWWKVIRLVLAVLIMLRIDDKITCSWQIVFIPLYLVAVKYIIQHIKGYRTFSRMQNAEMRQQGHALMTASACTLTVLGSLVYSLVGLLAAKLDGHAYSASRNKKLGKGALTKYGTGARTKSDKGVVASMWKTDEVCNSHKAVGRMGAGTLCADDAGVAMMASLVLEPPLRIHDMRTFAECWEEVVQESDSCLLTLLV
ncbi:hypothetical protein K457DRAFT_155201 [Linnemannia elongata AG-77]|uniref:J domain-containing protein n=1 Tax=Linnemannia elongata AG-77 TaxID=1314771 RepID=A0A197JXY9_9FUNG|nr:hypothetical protein K457DRAFT_155201 [Linnemannia elongata AG-77]